MKKLTVLLLVPILAAVIILPALAGTTSTQTFSVQVTEINELSVSGSPAAMVISAATAGSEPDSIINETTSYSITTNGSNKQITAQITSGTNMLANMLLRLRLTACEGASSIGEYGGDYINLNTTSSQQLVYGIESVADNTGNTIHYVLVANASGGTLTSASKTITLTLSSAGK